jgi:hypothetical protein
LADSASTTSDSYVHYVKQELTQQLEATAAAAATAARTTADLAEAAAATEAEQARREAASARRKALHYKEQAAAAEEGLDRERAAVKAAKDEVYTLHIYIYIYMCVCTYTTTIPYTATTYSRYTLQICIFVYSHNYVVFSLLVHTSSVVCHYQCCTGTAGVTSTS